MKHFDSRKIGVSTNLFHNIYIDEILEVISQLKQSFSAIEIEIEHRLKGLLDSSSVKASFSSVQNTINQLQQLAESGHIDLSIHAPYIGNQCDLAADDDATRQISCEYLHRSIKLCVRLGVKRLTYHPGYRAASSLEKSLDNLKRSLNNLVPVAAQHSIQLCLENTGDDRPTFLLFSPAQYIDLARQTGTFLTLDLIHHASLFFEDDYPNEQFFQTAAEMLPYVRNVHIADMRIPQHIHLPMGQGNLPVSDLLQFLADYNYRGNVIIEETGGGFSSQQFVAAAKAFKANYVGVSPTLTCV